MKQVTTDSETETNVSDILGKEISGEEFMETQITFCLS